MYDSNYKKWDFMPTNGWWTSGMKSVQELIKQSWSFLASIYPEKNDNLSYF